MVLLYSTPRSRQPVDAIAAIPLPLIDTVKAIEQ